MKIGRCYRWLTSSSQTHNHNLNIININGNNNNNPFFCIFIRNLHLKCKPWLFYGGHIFDGFQSIYQLYYHFSCCSHCHSLPCPNQSFGHIIQLILSVSGLHSFILSVWTVRGIFVSISIVLFFHAKFSHGNSRNGEWRWWRTKKFKFHPLN